RGADERRDPGAAARGRARGGARPRALAPARGAESAGEPRARGALHRAAACARGRRIRVSSGRPDRPEPGRLRARSEDCARGMTLRGLWLAAALAALVFVTLASGAGPRPPAPPSGATVALLSQPPTRLALASDRIYSVITDRYANGESANDTGGIV